ncbi:PAP2 superfamily protein [Mariniflexile fucanivorans]|uniref:PAP2 superfamily protein n=1 Tax=Mariniflexile fucanivorans TaxID=264023 RepID=A0A4V2QDC1_9FLAO|nr:phosphatase PAP2 family protein [Mariniflexile fucanivorans]TCL63077.1 PAP2 superfamily protein [Mariniflexile fucanivorans]
MKPTFFIVIFLLISYTSRSQNTQNDSVPSSNTTTFKPKALIIPTLLIGYGVVGLESHTLKLVNSEISEEVKEHIDDKFTIDDISQYTPFASVYALNALGINGKHNFKDRTIILGTAYLIMGGTVNVLKHTGTVVRPDGSSNNSFPSGHTATAFMGAEFLMQEYKDTSIWYGITGYVIATGTGLFRVYNDRHWLTDVAAGAGIGILSTKIAYWTHPFIKKHLLKDKETLNAMVMPFYNGHESGLGVIVSF